jgi:ABC-type multidrug transport system fused ATPase/permease subunit
VAKCCSNSCPHPACNNDPVLCPGTMKCEPMTHASLKTIDDICVYIFTLEYVLRVLSCTTVPMRLSGTLQTNWHEEEILLAQVEKREPTLDPPNSSGIEICFMYMTQLRNLIDLVSVLPFYISLITPYDFGLSYIRILRVFRVLRAGALISEAGKPSDSVITMLLEVCASTVDVIIFILLIALLLVFIFGTILFDLEKGIYMIIFIIIIILIYMINNEFPNGAWLRTKLDGSSVLSPFQSMFTGMYWAITTMTTVGYGDVYPLSVGGRSIACLLMIVGLLFMSLPIAIIGSKVTVEYDRLNIRSQQAKQTKKKEHLERRVSRVSGMSVHELKMLHPSEETAKAVARDATDAKRTVKSTKYIPVCDSHTKEGHMSSDVQQTSEISVSGISADLGNDSELRAILRDFSALQQRLQVSCSKNK